MFVVLTALLAMQSAPPQSEQQAAPITNPDVICVVGSRERFEKLEAMKIEISELRLKIEEYEGKREALQQEIDREAYKRRTLNRFNRLGVDGMERRSETDNPIHALRNQENIYRKKSNEAIARRKALMAAHEALLNENGTPSTAVLAQPTVESAPAQSSAPAVAVNSPSESREC